MMQRHITGTPLRLNPPCERQKDLWSWGIRNFALYFNTRSLESVLRHWTNKGVERVWRERERGGGAFYLTDAVNFKQHISSFVKE